MKRLLAALSCVLLLGQMFAVGASLTCAAPAANDCAGCCRNMEMKCCETEKGSRSQPSAIPTRASSQSQLIVLALTVFAANYSPVESTQPGFSHPGVHLAARAIPIFQRNCAMLI